MRMTETQSRAAFAPENGVLVRRSWQKNLLNQPYVHIAFRMSEL